MQSKTHFLKDYNSALSEKRFSPAYQPIVRLADTEVAGFELLSRWYDTHGTAVPPDVFIPQAEHAGCLDLLTDTIFQQALVEMSPHLSGQFLSLNISPSQLKSKVLVQRIADAANNHQFSLKQLKIEITETALIDDFEKARAIIEELAELGCSIAMDDFGTGFSSLSWLRSFPFDTLKIDVSFTRSMLHEKESRKIVTALIGLGQSLDLSVVAEGIETEEQADLLRRMGCQYGQGYLFGRPTTAQDAIKYIRQSRERYVRGSIEKMSLEERAYQISALYKSPDTSIAFLNPAFTTIDVSEAFATRHGRQISEIVGRGLADISPAKFKYLTGVAQQLIAGERLPPFEYRLPNGQTDLVSFSRVLDEAGELLGYSILAIDLSAQKNAEEALRKSEEHYRLIALLSPRTYWQADVDGRVIKIDDRFTDATKVVLDDVEGDKWLNLVIPADRSRCLDAWNNSIKTGQIYDVEVRCFRQDRSEYWCRLYAAPKIDEAGRITGWFGQSEDITKQKVSSAGHSDMKL